MQSHDNLDQEEQNKETRKRKGTRTHFAALSRMLRVRVRGVSKSSSVVHTPQKGTKSSGVENVSVILKRKHAH